MHNWFKNWLKHFIFGHSSTLILMKGLKKALYTKQEINTKKTLILIRKKSKILFQQNRQLVIDSASYGHLEFSTHILAAYQILLPLFNDNQHETIDFIKTATLRAYDSFQLRTCFKIIFYYCKNNPKRLNTVFSWMMSQYGSSFEWQTITLSEPKSFSLDIQQCFYYNFFKLHRVEFLTPILCQLDSIWFRLIDDSKHGLKFNTEIYQTQGYGAKTCKFPVEVTSKDK